MIPLFPLLDLLLPGRCLLCGGGASEYLCRGCRLDLPWLGSHCRQCGLPLAQGQGSCGHCLQHPPPFSRSVAAFTFAQPVDRLILAFKYRRQLAVGRLLSQLLAAHLRQSYARDSWPQLITPVPLHWRRLLPRGFNQAALLARDLGAALQLPVVNCCRRKRHTTPQQGTGRRRRQRNLKAAFALRRNMAQAVSGRHIAIVDDVVTTGATVAEMSMTLVEAGATRIDIWCIARTAQSY